ncbi:MAG: S8 family peptidase [Lachnospiraceae bacterium]|nr:S8 family peptidase [Lachnospiraceae bacterium]
MDQVKKQIGWESGHRPDVTGKGVGVAVLDTGVYLHPDLREQVAGFKDMVRGRQLPYDDNSHGTHVCGIIGGSGQASGGRFRGMAPECRLVCVKVLDQKGNGYASDVLAGLRWVRENRERYGIRIVNISVGSFNRKAMGENSALVKGVDAAWDEGLVMVIAAGNQGPKAMSITTPGISRKAITVGSSDDDREITVMGNRLVDYSGRGPTRDCVRKPDIVAPGSGIISCSNLPGKYQIKSGTSMSTPLVSGAIALLLEKYPEMTNKDVKLRLRERAVDLGLPPNQQGWGMLHVGKLLESR